MAVAASLAPQAFWSTFARRSGLASGAAAALTAPHALRTWWPQQSRRALGTLLSLHTLTHGPLCASHARNALLALGAFRSSRALGSRYALWAWRTNKMLLLHL